MRTKLAVILIVFLGLGYFFSNLYFERFTKSQHATNTKEDKFVPRIHAKQERKPQIISFPDRMPDYDVSVRSPEEWQGMEVSEFQPPCGAKDGCGLAMACIGGKCLGCREDDDCANSESCILQHCLRSENVECVEQGDCTNDSLCVLSGYSTGVRGNIDMRSFCRASSGGEKQVYDHEERLVFDKIRGPYEPSTLEISTIIEGLVYEADH